MMEDTGERLVPGRTAKRIMQDHRERYSFAADFCHGERVLDIACGVGFGSRLLCDAGASEVIGVDISINAIRYAQQHFHRSMITYEKADIVDYSSASVFGVVVCFETIEHISDYRTALRNLNSLLVPGGVLLISSPNRAVTSPDAASLSDAPKNRHHVQEFEIEELASELRAARFVTQKFLGQRQSSLLELKRAKDGHAEDPKYIKSPKVTPILGGVPRYFLIVASKA